MVAALAFATGASARSAGPGSQGLPFQAAEVAPSEVCPGQTAVGLGAEEQVRVMLCMTNYAREVNGLRPLTLSRPLGRAAEQKSADIVTCDEFSHEACGRRFTFWDRRYGYLKGCWKAAENIAWGTGGDASVEAIFTAWLQSPEHHANILGPYREIGIGVRIGPIEGNEGAAVWTQDFGSHQC
ncbi:MAG TPA: CAP domain-containing protein [Solirubrobacterales bacterium]|nr:CAP domain-containing protein [Solirubrobacterales bacterium]